MPRGRGSGAGCRRPSLPLDAEPSGPGSATARRSYPVDAGVPFPGRIRATGGGAMGRASLLAALACVVVACGGSSSSGDVPGTSTVSGYVYEGSPVVVVGIAADAPPGDVAVANAEVRA